MASMYGAEVKKMGKARLGWDKGRNQIRPSILSKDKRNLILDHHFVHYRTCARLTQRKGAKDPRIQLRSRSSTVSKVFIFSSRVKGFLESTPGS